MGKKQLNILIAIVLVLLSGIGIATAQEDLELIAWSIQGNAVLHQNADGEFLVRADIDGVNYEFNLGNFEVPLINIGSFERDGMMQVVVADTENSYLFQLVFGEEPVLFQTLNYTDVSEVSHKVFAGKPFELGMECGITEVKNLRLGHDEFSPHFSVSCEKWPVNNGSADRTNTHMSFLTSADFYFPEEVRTQPVKLIQKVPAYMGVGLNIAMVSGELVETGAKCVKPPVTWFTPGYASYREGGSSIRYHLGCHGILDDGTEVDLTMIYDAKHDNYFFNANWHEK